MQGATRSSDWSSARRALGSRCCAKNAAMSSRVRASQNEVERLMAREVDRVAERHDAGVALEHPPHLTVEPRPVDGQRAGVREGAGELRPEDADLVRRRDERDEGAPGQEARTHHRLLRRLVDEA